MTIRPPGPYLTDQNGHEHPLNPKGCTIGRAVENEIVIANKSISREHSRLYQDGRHWYITDLGSTNGTFLNGERVIAPMGIRDGDTIKTGEITFSFNDPDTTTRENPMPELDVDTIGGVVRLNRKQISLSPKEYQLLAYLQTRRGQVCSKDDIGHAVWPEYETGGIFDYQIENLVRRLRTRIEVDPANPQLLFTIRGLGYKLIVN